MTNEIITLIINQLRSTKAFRAKRKLVSTYPLLKELFYYASRLILHQRTEFTNSDYDKIRKSILFGFHEATWEKCY